MRHYLTLLVAATALSSTISAASAQVVPTSESTPQATATVVQEPAPQATSTPITTALPTTAPKKPMKPTKAIDSLGDFAIAPPDQPHNCEARRFYSSGGDGGRIVCDSSDDFEHGFAISSRLKKDCHDMAVAGQEKKKYVCIITD
ncbi:hypothetical protein BH11PAT2_BH11PAT2_06230 [soil metagenome]